MKIISSGYPYFLVLWRPFMCMFAKKTPFGQSVSKNPTCDLCTVENIIIDWVLCKVSRFRQLYCLNHATFIEAEKKLHFLLWIIAMADFLKCLFKNHHDFYGWSWLEFQVQYIHLSNIKCLLQKKNLCS